MSDDATDPDNDDIHDTKKMKCQLNRKGDDETMWVMTMNDSKRN